MFEAVDDSVSDLPQVAPVVDAIALIRGVAARPGYSLSNAEVLAGLQATQARMAVTESAFLRLVHELETRPGIIEGIPAGKAARTFLTEVLHRSGHQVARDLRTAAAVAGVSPDLPAMSAALLEGAVSRDHADVAASALEDISREHKTKIVTGDDGSPVTGLQLIDSIVTHEARAWAPGQIKNLVVRLTHHLDPDRGMQFDREACERRSCTVVTESYSGMGVYKAVLDPVTHLQVNTVLDKVAEPRPHGTAITEDGSTVSVPDPRTPSHRRADAFADLMLAGATYLGITITPASDPATEPGTGPVVEPAAGATAEPAV